MYTLIRLRVCIASLMYVFPYLVIHGSTRPAGMSSPQSAAVTREKKAPEGRREEGSIASQTDMHSIGWPTSL